MGSTAICIQTNEKLDELRSIMRDAIDCFERALSSECDLSASYALFESASILIDEGNPEISGYLCAEHLFYYCMSESWRNPYSVRSRSKIDLLFESTIRYLRKRGYKRVKKPEEGDVVAYGNYNIEDRFCAEHFGIIRNIQKDGAIEVESKFGRGPILRHLLEIAPYGNYIMFFRKHE